MKSPARVLVIAAVCQFGLLLCRAQGVDSVAPASAKAVPNGDANADAASVETWAPEPEAAEKPDLQKILKDARELTEKGRYEEALQRYIWYHNHALEYDPNQRGVRLSFALADWIELGREYPKALQALVEIRDRDTQRFYDGRGSFKLFMDVHSINSYLGQDGATHALFKDIERQYKPLAQQCFPVVESLLVVHHEYSLCFDYIGDPQSAYERITDSRARLKAMEDRQAVQQEERRKRMEAMGQTNPAFAHLPLFTGPPKVADRNFVDQTRQLIEILVGANHRPDAEKIREEALGILNDGRIKSAISDAEENIRKPAEFSAAASPRPVSLSFQPNENENQNKNDENKSVTIDPQTGLPVHAGDQPGGIDPWTGRPIHAADQPGGGY